MGSGMISMLNFLPKAAAGRDVLTGRDKLLIREGTEGLPITSPRDDWELVSMAGVSYIQRTFELQADQVKMLVCDIVDAQEEYDHTVTILIEGNKVTIRSTTHEHGEPTERDRQISRHIDTSYNEMRSIYR
jgi:pterin-4a-carbinolamine dehydratase